MKSTESTVSVKHKKNGIEREFTPTQLDLMGKNNRKAFKQAKPAEVSGDANDLAEKREAQKLEDENASLRKQLADALAGKATPEPENVGLTATAQQLENQGKRAENAQLKADLSTAISSLQTSPVVNVEETDEDEDEGDGDETDPNPALTALRKQYEDLTGKKPGRLGIDKLNEAVVKALAEKGDKPATPA